MAKNKVKVEYDVDMEKERRKKQQKNGKRSVGKQSRMEGAVQKRCDITVCVDCIPSGSCAGRKLYSQCSDHWIHGK